MADLINSIDISALQEYAGTHKKELISLAIKSNEVFEKMNVIPGVVNKITLTDLQAEPMLKPFDKDWNPDEDKLKLVPRTLTTELGQIEIQDTPLRYRKLYDGSIFKSGVNPDDHPFEKYFLEAIMKRISLDINNILAFWGDKSIDNPIDAIQKVKSINDGFFTIIDREILANKISSSLGNLINTEVISASNAVHVFDKFYNEACNHNPSFRSVPTKLYVSYTAYDAYKQHMLALTGGAKFYDKYEQEYVRASAGKCRIEPMSGMSTTLRMLMGPEEIFNLGCDLESDKEDLQIWRPNPKVMGILGILNIGFELTTLKDWFFTNQNTIDDASGSASASASSSVSSSAP